MLDYLTHEFIDHHFDVRHVLRLICRSRTYQLSIDVNRWNDDDKINYSHAVARRLPAEVLYDAIHRVTGSVSRIPGVPAGTRAAALPDSGVNLPDGFLTNLGRPARESVCECERSSGLQLGPVMALISGPTVEAAISDPQSELSKLVAAEKDDARLVGEIFLRVLNRPATAQEIEVGRAALRRLPEAHQQLTARLEAYEKQSGGNGGRSKSKSGKRRSPGRNKSWKPTRNRSLRKWQPGARAAAADCRRPRPLCASRRRRCRSVWPHGKSRPRIRPPGHHLWQPRLRPRTTAKLTQEADRSVVASGPNGKAIYVFIAENDLPNVTGLRLEALADERLPAKGPGRAPNGNFVLSQFLVEWHPLKEPKKKARVALQNAQADFSQDGYDVQTAIGRIARQGLGRRAQDGPVAHGRLRDARQRRRSGSFHDPHASRTSPTASTLSAVSASR